MIDIAVMKPANKTAAMVVARNNEPVSHKPVHKYNNRLTTMFNIPLRELPKTLKNNVQFEDFTGQKYGKLTVLGLFRDAAKWVVKCSCGNQEFRGNKSLKNKSDRAQCKECEDIERIRRTSFWRTHGFNIEDIGMKK